MTKRSSQLVALPYLAWMVIFMVIPLALIVVFAFTTSAPFDAATGERLEAETAAAIMAEEQAAWEENETPLDARVSAVDHKTIFTVDNILEVNKFMPTMLNSVWMALIATVVCLLIGYPLAFLISRMHFVRQKFMIMLIMLPMWMNFLLRTYAWMTLLERNGLINRALALFGLGPFEMINTQGAVILGMIYNYLPFMILPLYSVMTKIDNTTIEAAHDLGANRLMTMARVVIPLSVPGINSGITAVFIPSVSTFIISRMLGGGTNMLIGDLIDLQFLGNAYNPNLGSAISLVLMVFILLCMSITGAFDASDKEGGMLV